MLPLPFSRADKKCRISIVMPALHEADTINSIIGHLYDQEFCEDYEIIVVDGDPDGETISAIQHRDVKTIVSARGRARQMNAGAAIASGDILLFLHADTRLPVSGLQKISSIMEQEQYVAGAFSLRIDSSRLSLRILSSINSLRFRLTRIAYGDQAIFVRRNYFNEIGCYKDIPLMEDVELMQRIKMAGDKIAIIPDRVMTSSRRWEIEGPIYCLLRNIIILNLYYMGASPHKLVKYYRSDDPTRQKLHTIFREIS